MVEIVTSHRSGEEELRDLWRAREALGISTGRKRNQPGQHELVSDLECGQRGRARGNYDGIACNRAFRCAELADDRRQSFGVPRIVGKTMSGKIKGASLDVQGVGKFPWQRSPGVEIRTRLVEEEDAMIAESPANPADRRTPRELLLDDRAVLLRIVAHAPHSECL
jgi:hypothetical protein